MSAKKGSAFERQVCKQLGLWWSGGKRDDIFWRSSQSGGRATQRAKFGRKTYGSYGDIAAVDPIGQPLLQLLTIELKRGRSHGCLADLIDTPAKARKRAFEEALKQTINAALRAESTSWALIFRRDCKDAVICVEAAVGRALLMGHSFSFARFQTSHLGHSYAFVALTLETFLKLVTPRDIQRVLKQGT